MPSLSTMGSEPIASMALGWAPTWNCRFKIVPMAMVRVMESWPTPTPPQRTHLGSCGHPIPLASDLLGNKAWDPTQANNRWGEACQRLRSKKYRHKRDIFSFSEHYLVWMRRASLRAKLTQRLGKAKRPRKWGSSWHHRVAELIPEPTLLLNLVFYESTFPNCLSQYDINVFCSSNTLQGI